MSKRNRVELEHKVEELESERTKKDGKLRKMFKALLNIAAAAKLVKTVMDLIEWLT